MSGGSDDKDKDKKDGKLLSFPGGKSVSPSDIGVGDFVIDQAGHIPTPELQDPQDIEKEARERASFVRGQELVRVMEQKAPTADMIDVLLREMAEETSHLKWEREKSIKSGKSSANFNIARIASLRSLTEILLKRKEADLAERLDLKSERFQKIFKVWMEFFYEAMDKSGVDAEVIDLVFKTMKADMVDWERKMDAG